MDLNLGTFSFLFLRLAPFILICFFTLSSLFNNDLRGIVYLFGVLFAVFINFGVATSFTESLGVVPEEFKSEICDFTLFGTSGSTSPIPIGETIISFTFFYLFTTLILKDRDYINKVVNFDSIPNVPTLGECFVTPWQMLSLDFLKFIPSIFLNIPSIRANLITILFFFILIMFDLFWNTPAFKFIRTNIMKLPLTYCYTGYQSATAYLIGLFVGIIWSNIIYSTKTPSLQYFPNYKNNEFCKRISNTRYKCKVYKNGQLMSSNI